MFLVLSGVRGHCHEKVLQAIEELGLRNHVVHVGYLPYDQIAVLFHAAHGLIFPSLFEGFGYPVVEAMVSGCPVACSHVTSLCEIGGDAAIYFDPNDIQAISDAVLTLWGNHDVREHLASCGRHRARLFSWRSSVEQILELYRQVSSLGN